MTLRVRVHLARCCNYYEDSSGELYTLITYVQAGFSVMGTNVFKCTIFCVVLAYFKRFLRF